MARLFSTFFLSICCVILLFATNSAPASTQMKIDKITGQLANPWGMTLIDNKHILVTLRAGQLVQISLSSGIATPVGNLPDIVSKGQGGLLDILYHKGEVFLCYSAPQSGRNTATSVLRARLNNNQLTDRKQIFTSNFSDSNGYHFGCRMVIKNETLYLSVGERNERDTAQDGTLHSGAIIGISLSDNMPLTPARPDWAAGILSKGHRNPQGMAIHPDTQEIWIHEHGPRGGDEINIFTAGANYGWPITSFGREYYGAKIGKGITSAPGITDPVWHWTPSIAPSGMAFYTGDMFDFKGQLLVGSLKFRSLYLVTLKDNRPSSETVLLKNKIGRIRDVEIAPDGAILLLSDETDGGLYRLSRP